MQAMYIFPTMFSTLFARGFQKRAAPNVIPVYPRLAELRGGEPVMRAVWADLRKRFDPSGEKTAVLSRKAKGHVTAGDVVTVNWKNRRKGFTGLCLGVLRAQNATNILLRNKVNNTGVELRIPVYLPLVERVEVMLRDHRLRGRRHKLYWVRESKHDVGGDLGAKMEKRYGLKARW